MHEIKKILLVRSFEVTTVMATSLKQQSHVNITLQHSIAHIHFLGGRFPFHGLLLHNWTFGRKVHSIKSNFIEKTVVGVFLHSDKKEIKNSHVNMQK